MPKTTINENNTIIFFEGYVWFSSKRFILYPEPKAISVQIFPDNDFGFSVLTPNPAHCITSCCFRIYICHIAMIVNLHKASGGVARGIEVESRRNEAPEITSGQALQHIARPRRFGLGRAINKKAGTLTE